MIKRLVFLVLAAVMATTCVAPVARAETTDAILDSLQYGAFRYAWDQANATTGLIKDRSTPGSPCSIAAQGFGFSTICIAVDHGWVSRADAATRVLAALNTLWSTPQSNALSGTSGYKGLYYHFLDMATGLRFQPSVWHPELSTIDTALLLAGILDARQYFDGSDPTEVQIRNLADSIWQRVDWTFVQTCASCCPAIYMGWKPESGFTGFGAWFGYNEASIMYLLAIGSPTHPIPGCAWTGVWTATYNWNTQYGQTYVIFPPLFGHQYSHCWIDFRLVQDAYMLGKGITYFENSRRATLAQQAYCIANPGAHTGYSATMWGLTASDDPGGYLAHGAPPAQNDNGTITPTAAISSIPFAPEIVIPTILNMYNNYKNVLWTPYGFRDAFNLQVNWYGADVLGIDQGPIAIMIENYRTSRVWNRMMRHPDLRNGLALAGFTGIAGVGPTPATASLELSAAPNPFAGETVLHYSLALPGRVRLTLYDVTGRAVARPVDGVEAAGPHDLTFDARSLPSGVYRCRMEADGAVRERTLVHLR